MTADGDALTAVLIRGCEGSGEKLPYRNVGRLKAQVWEFPIKLCSEFMSLKAFFMAKLHTNQYS
jgi:hypothetical protein